MKKEDARASESNRLDGVSRRRRARGARVSPPSRHLVAGVGGSIGSASSSSVDGARPMKKKF
jgi:hypothetical protein